MQKQVTSERKKRNSCGSGKRSRNKDKKQTSPVSTVCSIDTNVPVLLYRESLHKHIKPLPCTAQYLGQRQALKSETRTGDACQGEFYSALIFGGLR